MIERRRKGKKRKETAVESVKEDAPGLLARLFPTNSPFLFLFLVLFRFILIIL